MTKKIDSNLNDKVASVSRSIVGAIPFAGPLLTEIATSIIPNQRIDRISKFVENLERRIKKLEDSELAEAIKNDQTVEIIEEGFEQASRTLSTERREYLAALVSNGISSDEETRSEVRMLLRILKEITDVEIIWLRSYLYSDRTYSDPNHDLLFRNKYNQFLQPVYASYDSSLAERKKESTQNLYRHNLESYGLIENRIKINPETRMPEFDHLGKPRINNTFITELGKSFLEMIDFVEID